MGLPGSGKTTLAEKLFNEVCKNNPAEWINADDVRKECNDWDFSPVGQLRQAKRMRIIADRAVSAGFITICDFDCTTQALRSEIDANMIIWMDTISAGTDVIFELPTEQEYDIRIDKFDSDSWAETLADLIYMII